MEYTRDTKTPTKFAWNIETFVVLSICHNNQFAIKDILEYENIDDLYWIFDVINSLMNLKIKKCKEEIMIGQAPKVLWKSGPR